MHHLCEASHTESAIAELGVMVFRQQDEHQQQKHKGNASLLVRNPPHQLSTGNLAADTVIQFKLLRVTVYCAGLPS